MSQNKVKIDKTAMSSKTEVAKHCLQQLRKNGFLLAQDIPNAEYMGSLSIHMFKRKNLLVTNKHEYFFVSQNEISKVEEGMCDVAHKELKKDLMKAYGRKIPKKNNEIVTGV